MGRSPFRQTLGRALLHCLDGWARSWSWAWVVMMHRLAECMEIERSLCGGGATFRIGLNYAGGVPKTGPEGEESAVQFPSLLGFSWPMSSRGAIPAGSPHAEGFHRCKSDASRPSRLGNAGRPPRSIRLWRPFPFFSAANPRRRDPRDGESWLEKCGAPRRLPPELGARHPLHPWRDQVARRPSAFCRWLRLKRRDARARDATETRARGLRSALASRFVSCQAPPSKPLQLVLLENGLYADIIGRIALARLTALS